MQARTACPRGLSLIELMVAMAVGLLVALVVGSIFVQGSRSHGEDDRYARMIENGRFALAQVTRSLRLAGFVGESKPGTSTAGSGPGTVCDINLSDTTRSVLFNSPADSSLGQGGNVGALAFNYLSCPSVIRSPLAGRGSLAVKHVGSTALSAGQVNGTWYIRANASGGTFKNNAGSDPLESSEIAEGMRDWAYMPAIFHIGQFTDESGTSQPYLCRSVWSGSTFVSHASNTAARDACLAVGIEQFNVQFGVDTDDDGIANRYTSEPTASEMEDAVTARVHVLARSDTPDPTYLDGKTYALGDVEVNAAVLPVDERRFHRRVFTSTVKLRNFYNRITGAQ